MCHVARSITAVLVLANYLLAFVAGDCLHHHRHQAGAPAVCAQAGETRAAAGGCHCHPPTHGGQPASPQELTAREDLSGAEGAGGCAVCQLLAQKFLPTRQIDAVTYEELRATIASVQPPLLLAASAFSWHSRAPPRA